MCLHSSVKNGELCKGVIRLKPLSSCWWVGDEMQEHLLCLGIQIQVMQTQVKYQIVVSPFYDLCGKMVGSLSPNLEELRSIPGDDLKKFICRSHVKLCACILL